MRLLALFVGLVAVTLPAAASAQESPAKETRTASVTFSPIHLLFPIAEVTAEFALTPKIGVAGIVGFGSVPFKTTVTSGRTTTENTERLRAWELGAHFNYYVLGTFDHGMQLGVEALYLKVARPASGTVQIAAAADGFAIGPYVGYKLITRVGFTFEANGGVQYVAARASATDGNTTETASDKRVIPLLNLNVGWSF